MSLSPQHHEYPFYFVFTEDSVLRVPRLPPEMLIAILKHLPADELRRICLLSRKFRDMAHTAGLTIHRTISNAGQLAAWVQIVDYALLQKETFRLSVSIDHRGMQQGISQYLVMGTLSAVSRALPRLARLRVNSSCYVIDLLLARLAEPVPYLRTLEIRHWDTDVNVSLTSLPTTLLDAQPALLRTVTLAVPLLASLPASVPALANVSVVHLTIGTQQHALAVARLFPAARELHLRVHWAEHGVAVDLSQLSPRLLVVEEPYYGSSLLEFTLCRGARAPQVAAVEYTGTTVPQHELLWPAHVRGVTGRMRHSGMNSHPILEFTSNEALWRLTSHLPLSSSWRPTTLAQLQCVPLVALFVEESLLDALVQSPISLVELRELSIDVSVPTRRAYARHNWDIPGLVVHAAILAYLSISCVLHLSSPLESLFAVPIEVVHLVRLVLFLSILAAAFGFLSVWEQRRLGPRQLARLSCPALERVTFFAGKDTPPVLCSARIAPVLDLLAHCRVRPKIVLVGGVELDVWAKLSVMWRTFRIPVSV